MITSFIDGILTMESKMNTFRVKTIMSMMLFFFLMMLSIASIVLGFTIISFAETTFINQMLLGDWILCITGALFIFSSFIFINLLGKVRRF